MLKITSHQFTLHSCLWTVGESGVLGGNSHKYKENMQLDTELRFQPVDLN